jgi:hypothetical protein
MSDPLRTDTGEPPDGQAEGERGAKIESLLLAGLDHYFAAEYEQAANVWTRVLFLDRGHTRARAYIERARSALAEQQRESEELLQSGVAAFQRGEAGAARRLLNSAVERGGPQDVALAFLARLNRLDMATGPGTAGRQAAVRRPAGGSRTPSGHTRLGLWIGLMAVALAVGALVGLVSWERIGSRGLGLVPGPAAESSGTRRLEEPLPLPRVSETALERARALRRSGRLYDALRAVELVRPADPLRQEADRLKAEIQRELLAHPLVDVGQPGPTPADRR